MVELSFIKEGLQKLNEGMQGSGEEEKPSLINPLAYLRDFLDTLFGEFLRLFGLIEYEPCEGY